MFILCTMFVHSLLSPDHSPSYEFQLMESFQERTAVCMEVAEAAQARGEDWELMVSLAFEESRFVPAESSAGAIGPMQILPQYFCADGADGCDLVQAGLDAWRAWLETVSEDDPSPVSTALCRYNSGNGCTSSGRRYARRVLGRLERMRARAASIASQLDRSDHYCFDTFTGWVEYRYSVEASGSTCLEMASHQ